MHDELGSRQRVNRPLPWSMIVEMERRGGGERGLGRSGVVWIGSALPSHLLLLQASELMRCGRSKRSERGVPGIVFWRGDFAPFQRNRQVRAEERFATGKAKVKQLKRSKDPKGELRW